MRKILIRDNEAKTIEQAENIAPWASTIIEVDGGFMAFESAFEADAWEFQI